MRRNHEGVSEDLTRVFIDEEYLPFPVGAHDDMLDGLSRIVDPEFPVKAPRETRRTGPRPARANSRYNPMRWRVHG